MNVLRRDVWAWGPGTFAAGPAGPKVLVFLRERAGRQPYASHGTAHWRGGRHRCEKYDFACRECYEERLAVLRRRRQEEIARESETYDPRAALASYKEALAQHPAMRDMKREVIDPDGRGRHLQPMPGYGWVDAMGVAHGTRELNFDSPSFPMASWLDGRRAS